MTFLIPPRHEAPAGSIIVAFHVYVALVLEGLWFLIPVVIIGALIGGAIHERWAWNGPSALPQAAYLLLVPELIAALSSENLRNHGVRPHSVWFATIFGISSSF